LTVIAERFFLSKVEPAIRALGWDAVIPDYEGDVQSQIASSQPIGIVLDLENEAIDTLDLAQCLRGDPALNELPVLGYASHERPDLLEQGREIGIQVVPRSTFAGNLVRVLMDLVGQPLDHEGEGGTV